MTTNEPTTDTPTGWSKAAKRRAAKRRGSINSQINTHRPGYATQDDGKSQIWDNA